MLVILFMLNGDPKRFKKLIDEIQNDSLKGLGIYSITVAAAAQQLMISHSRTMVVRTKQHNNEVVFSQTSNAGKPCYGSRRNSCHICREKGQHS